MCSWLSSAPKAKETQIARRYRPEDVKDRPTSPDTPVKSEIRGWTRNRADVSAVKPKTDETMTKT